MSGVGIEVARIRQDCFSPLFIGAWVVGYLPPLMTWANPAGFSPLFIGAWVVGSNRPKPMERPSPVSVPYSSGLGLSGTDKEAA